MYPKGLPHHQSPSMPTTASPSEQGPPVSSLVPGVSEVKLNIQGTGSSRGPPRQEDDCKDCPAHPRGGGACCSSSASNTSCFSLVPSADKRMNPGHCLPKNLFIQPLPVSYSASANFLQCSPNKPGTQKPEANRCPRMVGLASSGRPKPGSPRPQPPQPDPCRIIRPTNLLSGKLSSCNTGSCYHGNKIAH